MVSKINPNVTLVSKFEKQLKKKIKLDRLILFGSRAKGTYNQESDFDLVVVSSDFKKTPWYKRSVELHLLWKEDYPIELLCYTPEEFERKKKEIGIVQTAWKEGIEI